MKKERNIIGQILDRLQREYAASKGWQVEYVDLRFGISKEASASNQTMRICLNELKRCQDLSPRPNFIVMLGERVGWFPLPEVIPASDYKRLLKETDWEEQLGLDLLYKFNNNILPDGVWELSPKYELSLPEDIYHNFENLLHILFNRVFPGENCYNLSATQQEIMNGILKSDKAGEHVIAYLRTIVPESIPQSKRENFYPSIQEHTISKKWHEKLCKELDDENVIYADELTWEEYCSAANDRQFAEDIEKRIRSLIDREIENYKSKDELDQEILRHAEYGEKLSRAFVGREKLVNTIFDSLCVIEKPILIIGNPGVGKSSLMGRMARMLAQNGFYVCVRFCSILYTGRTPDELVKSLSDELNNVKSPKFILIDGADELDLGNSLENKRLGWLVDFAKKYNAPLAVTVAKGGAVEHELPRFIGGNIEPVDAIEAPDVVVGILKEQGRRLTDAQMQDLRNQLSNTSAELSGLFLRLLASLLANLNSSDKLPAIPDSMELLVEKIADELASPIRHGTLLPHRVLALLSTIPEGLDYTNLSRIVDSDPRLRESISSTNFHDWDISEPHIPTIFLSRFLNDIDGTLVDMRIGSGGFRIIIRHPSIRKVLMEKWLNSDDKEFALRCAFNHFSKEWCNDNPIALHEIINSCCRLASGDKDDRNRFIAIQCGGTRLLEPRFVYLMAKADRTKLNRLYTVFYSVLSRFTTHWDTLNNFLSVQAIVRRWPVIKSFEHALAFSMNLPDNLNLKITAANYPESSRVLIDDLRDITTDHYIIQSLPDVAGMRLPKLTNEGKYLYYVYTEGNQSVINKMDVRTGLLRKVISNLPLSICSFAISGDANVKAVLYSRQERNKTLYVTNGTKSWHVDFSFYAIDVQVSPDGKWVIMLAEDGNAYIFSAADGKNIICQIDGKKIECVRFTPDGKAVWMVLDGEIRYCIIKENSEGCPVLSDKVLIDNEKDKVLWGKKKIVGAGNRCVFVYNENTFNYKMLVFSFDNSLSYMDSVHPGLCYVSVCEHCENERFFEFILCDTLGNAIKYASHLDKDGCKIEIKQSSSVFRIFDVSLDGYVALSMEDECIFDFKKMLNESFIINTTDNAGINNMTASLRSDKILISIGKNIAQEGGVLPYPILTELLPDGKWRERQLVVEGLKRARFSLSSVISPDGTLAAFYMYNPAEKIILYNLREDKGKEIVSISLGVVAMTFTADSKYLIALTGDYFANFSTIILVFDRNGKMVFSDSPKYFYKNGESEDVCAVQGATHIRITPDNRYLYFGSPTYVYDLIERCLISHEYLETDGWKPVIPNLKDRPFILEYNPLAIWDGRKHSILTSWHKYHYRFSLATKEICCSENTMKLVAVDFDVTLLLDEKTNTLYITDDSHPSPKPVAKDVVIAFPCFDCKHFYAYHTDQRISINNYEGQELQYTYLLGEISMRFQVTADGLMIGKSSGHAAFFRPAQRLGVNAQMVVRSISRWDLITKTYSEPYAICPRCGCHIPASESTRAYIPCPKCGTPLKIIADMNIAPIKA